LLIVMHHKATRVQIDTIIAGCEKFGVNGNLSPESQRTAIGVLGNKGIIDDLNIATFRG